MSAANRRRVTFSPERILPIKESLSLYADYFGGEELFAYFVAFGTRGELFALDFGCTEAELHIYARTRTDPHAFIVLCFAYAIRGAYARRVRASLGQKIYADISQSDYSCENSERIKVSSQCMSVHNYTYKQSAYQ